MRRLLMVTLLLIGLVSCKKDDADGPKPILGGVEPFELVSTPGSWWVYDWYNVDTLGNSTYTGMRDSVYIVGDTVVNGYTYIIEDGSQFGAPYGAPRLYRDSSGFIVGVNGQVSYNYVRPGDTINTFHNNVAGFDIHRIVAKSRQTITTAAGTLSALVVEWHMENHNGTPFTPCDSIHKSYVYRVSGIGMVHQTNGYMHQLQCCCTILERRLVDFHIEP